MRKRIVKKMFTKKQKGWLVLQKIWDKSWKPPIN